MNYCVISLLYTPTGSTTATLLNFYHHITAMLENNMYVQYVCTDFSKASDTVNHQLLFTKLVSLHLKPYIVAIISSFLYQRTQSTC